MHGDGQQLIANEVKRSRHFVQNISREDQSESNIDHN